MRTLLMIAALALASCGLRDPAPPTFEHFDGGPPQSIDCPENGTCRCWVEDVEVTAIGCNAGAELGERITCCFGDADAQPD